MTTTQHARLNEAIDRITALERALKRLRTRIAAQEKRPAQVKVGACDTHLPQLRALSNKTSVHGVIRCVDITSISTPPQLA